MDRVRKWSQDLKKIAPKTIVCRKLEPPRQSPDGQEKSPPYTIPGAFNGWTPIRIGKDIKWKKTDNYAVGVDWDGYCEIPNTKFNRAKLKVETKPKIVVKPRAPKGTKYDPKTGLCFDPINKVHVALEEVTITEPPQFEILGEKARREYDPNSLAFDYIRPWARPFFNVKSMMSEDLANAQGPMIIERLA